MLSSYSSGWTTRPQKSNFVSLVASCPDRRDRKVLILSFLFPLFSDCFEDLLEGLDDDDDFLDEALLV